MNMPQTQTLPNQNVRTLGDAGRRLHALALAATVLLLSACATQQRAGMNAPAAGAATVPAGWQYATADAGGSPVVGLDEAWWKRFNTPELNALIERVLAANTNLATAAIRVRQAQLRAELASSARLPSVNGQVGVGASRALDQDNAATSRSANASLSASWELDLWGRLAARRDAAQWEAEATEDDRRAVALSLVGTTARLYWQLAYLGERVTSGESSLAYARQTLDLVKAQHRAGAVSALEEAQAEQAVRAQEGALAQLTQARMEARQALALLLDGPTQTAQLPPAQWPTGAWPTLAPDLPAQVLARRPDVRAAEARLRAAFATADATRTAYYPPITLTGGVGTGATSLGSVLSNPVGSLGAALVLPFLQWRDMQRNVAISQADADAAVLGFRQTLYTALADVDNALSAREQLRVQESAQSQRLVQARTVERLSELRYKSGAETLKSWLDAQESRRQAELAAYEVRFNQLSNWVSLVQALGGGASQASAATANAQALGMDSGAQMR